MRISVYLLTVPVLALLFTASAFSGNHPDRPSSATCVSCHSKLTATEFVHTPAKMSCTLCHDEQQPSSLHADANALCLECHSTAMKAKFEADEPVSLYSGKAKLPPKPFQNLHLLALSRDRGHPVANHPVLKKEDKDSPAIRCLTCHNPHGSNNSSAMLTTDSATSLTLCQRCHK